MKLRKEIKWFIIGLTISQAITYALHSYNAYLEHELAIKQARLSDIKVEIETLYNGFKTPCSTSSFKSYMDYRSITSEESEQYQFIQDHMEIKDGYLLDEYGYIGVALGSQFGDVGSRWVFKLDTGNEIYAVKIEHKDDSDTINGCEHKIDSSVIEFVIDKNYFVLGSNGYINNGNFDNVDWWNGNIESVKEVK